MLGFGGLGWVVVAYLGVLVIGSALLARPFPRVAAPKAAGPHEPVVRAWIDGLREIGREGRLRLAGVVVVLTSLAQGMFLVLFVVFVLDILDGTEGDVGLLRGVQALGGLAAGFAVATVARKVAPVALLGWGGLALGLLSAVIWNLPALTASLGVFIGLFGLVGAPGVLAGFRSALAGPDRRVPRTVRSRAEHRLRRNRGVHGTGRVADGRPARRAGQRRPAERPSGSAHRLGVGRAGRVGLGQAAP